MPASLGSSPVLAGTFVPRLFRSALEYVTHIHRCLSQRVFFDVGVDVRRGLVVRMADDPHCDQRVDAGLAEHGHILEPPEPMADR